MDMLTLATKHQETCKALSRKPRADLLLWYADLGVEVDDNEEVVDYHCPICGRRRTMPLELFVCVGERTDLRCSEY